MGSRTLTLQLCLVLSACLAILACEHERVQIDTTRPAAVTDLSIDSANGSILYFSWTATGDDYKQGKAFLYDLRFATDSATLKNWGNASSVLGEPIPDDPGSHEVMALDVALHSSTYYFGVKVSDDSRNTSALSNIVSY